VTATARPLVDVPCADIAASPDQNRETFDPVELQELADSIAESGLWQPLSVRLSVSDGLAGMDGPPYVLVAGERRLRACRDLLGWETVPCLVDSGDRDPLEYAIGTMAENMMRVDPAPMSEARGLQHVRELGGLEPADLARRLGKSPRWVRDRLALLELSDRAADLVERGTLPLWHAVLISALDANRQWLAIQAHERGLGRDAFRALVARLADEQAADAMFSADDFLVVDTYVLEAEAEAEDAKRAEVVREVPLGIAEIAELVGVRPATVNQWRTRGVLPLEDFRAGGAPLWWETTITAWADETGRR
jgi:ParB family chromosome partitioning protein